MPRSGTRVVQRLGLRAEFCPGRHRPKLGRIGSTLVELGPKRSNSDERGPDIYPRIGPQRPSWPDEWAKLGPERGTLDQHSPGAGQIWPGVDPTWSGVSHALVPNSANLVRTAALPAWRLPKVCAEAARDCKALEENGKMPSFSRQWMPQNRRRFGRRRHRQSLLPPPSLPYLLRSSPALALRRHASLAMV